MMAITKKISAVLKAETVCDTEIDVVANVRDSFHSNAVIDAAILGAVPKDVRDCASLDAANAV